MPNYFLRAASGQYVPLKLAGELGSGAAGKVYSLGAPEHKQLAAKIYGKASDCNVSRLTAMIGSPPDTVRDSKSDLAQFAWPSEVIYEREASQYRAIGFTMPKIDMQHSVSLEYYFDSTLAHRLSPDDRSPSSKLAIAHNLAALTADLHGKGSCFIDFKPQNMRVTKRNRLVSFLDCDGYRVTAKDGTVFGATHFSTGYIAPEALQNNHGPADLSYDQDRFALAVVLFQLLNFGIHPFQGIPNPNVDAQGDDDKVKARLYPYGIAPNRMMAPKKSSVHGLFPTRLRQLFDQAFLGRERPSARQWQEVLLSLQGGDGTVRCQVHPSNPEHGGFIGKGCLVCFRNKFIHVAPQPRPVVTVNPRVGARATVATQKNWATPTASSTPSPRLLPLQIGVGIFVGMIVLGMMTGPSKPDRVASPPEQAPLPPIVRPTPAPRPPVSVAPPVPVPPSANRGANLANVRSAETLDPDRARFDEVVQRLEIQHPQFDPQSTRYKQGDVDSVLRWTKYYASKGMPTSYALEAAVAEILREQKTDTESAIQPKERIPKDGSGRNSMQPKQSQKEVIKSRVTTAPPATENRAKSEVLSNCEAKAVSKDGNPLYGNAKAAFLSKCNKDNSFPVPQDGSAKSSALPRPNKGAVIESSVAVPAPATENRVTKPANSHWLFHFSRQTDVWECDIGYRLVGNSCDALPAPPLNAGYDQVGTSRWSCKVGYVRQGGACISYGVSKN